MSNADRRYPERPIVGVGGVILVDATAPVAGLSSSLPQPYGVVLVKRRFEPLAGHWSLPGGMLEIGETLEAGVVREILEETGLVVAVAAVVEVCDRIMLDDAWSSDDPIPNRNARADQPPLKLRRSAGQPPLKLRRPAGALTKAEALAKAEGRAYDSAPVRRTVDGRPRPRRHVGPTFRSGAQPGVRAFRSGVRRVRYHYVLIDYLCWPIGGALQAGSDVSDVSIADPMALATYDVTPKVETVVTRALEMGSK